MLTSIRPLVICSTAIILLGTISDTAARHARTIPKALYQEMLQCQIKAGEADQKMLKVMRSAADWLLEYCHENPGLLRSPRGCKLLLAHLKNEAVTNPYTEDDFLKKHLQSDSKELSDKVGFAMLEDLSLTQFSSREWSKQPPERWQAAPGTVCLIHNGEDLILLWAAGADGRPVKDTTTGDAQLIVERLD